jgi:hypothetical protein
VSSVGRLENIQEDAKRLLERIGARDEVGTTGWGRDGKESIFASGEDSEMIDSVRSSTSITPDVHRLLEEAYKADYNNGLFDFAKRAPSTV